MGVGEARGRVETGQAAAAVTANRIVNVDGSLAEDLRFQHAGANEPCNGVALEGRASGDRDLPVQIDGIIKVQCDGAAAIAVRDPIQSNATGQGVLATGTGTHHLIGRALEPLASGVQLINIQITLGQLQLA